MATTFESTTLETSMQMQTCRLFWHQSTLSIVLRRELADCTASRQVPVLNVKRPVIFGGNLEIQLCGSVHPVRMLPVSGKDVRNLCFGLVYGPKRKRVRFRAPDVATYDKWEMVLEVAVEKAAADRPTFTLWPHSSTSPSLSLLEDGEFSEEFGFSDGDGCDESKFGNHRSKARQTSQKATSRSFVNSMDPLIPKTMRSDQDEEEEFDHAYSMESKFEASTAPFAHEVEKPQPMLPSYQYVSRPVVVQDLTTDSDQEVVWKPQWKNLSITLLPHIGSRSTKLAVKDYRM